MHFHQKEEHSAELFMRFLISRVQCTHGIKILNFCWKNLKHTHKCYVVTENHCNILEIETQVCPRFKKELSLTIFNPFPEIY